MSERAICQGGLSRGGVSECVGSGGAEASNERLPSNWSLHRRASGRDVRHHHVRRRWLRITGGRQRCRESTIFDELRISGGVRAFGQHIVCGQRIVRGQEEACMRYAGRAAAELVSQHLAGKCFGMARFT